MFRSFAQKCDSTTLLVIGSIFAITLFGISLIQDVFVTRLMLKDAHGLSMHAADSFARDIISKKTKVDESGQRVPLDANTALFPAVRMAAPETQGARITQGGRHLAFEPGQHKLSPRLQRELSEIFYCKNNLNQWRYYALYLPSGKVMMPPHLFRNKKRRPEFLSSFPVISAVQSVFARQKPMHANYDTATGIQSRHFIPLSHQGHMEAVLMIETFQTAAGMELAGVVSSAVLYTTLAGLPMVMLLVYLVWSRMSEKLQAERKLNFLSQHDELTGLTNRALFYKTLGTMLNPGAGGDERCAILLIDVDDFHGLNDHIGHEGADKVLLKMVNVLLANKPQAATVARLSADEFAMIIPGISTADEAAELADELLTELTIDIDTDGDVLTVKSSIGIAFRSDKINSAETFMKNAKLALYLAKQDGGTYRFFEPSIDMALQKRRKLEMYLASALQQEQFDIYYQPQVALGDGKVIGYEALLRWHHPVLGLVSPAEFIPLLEETRKIVDVGQYVLERACREALDWPEPLKVAVNLSPVQFALVDVPQMVEEVLKKTGLPAERLELEITESVLMTDTDETLHALSALKRLGVDIAMDDFGTGYSSLSYISKFEFDKIKIDRSFISSIQTDERARVIISSVIGLGRSLNVMVTAEGIETNEQLLLIQSAGCHFGQGYLFGKPKPLEEIFDLNTSQRHVA